LQSPRRIRPAGYLPFRFTVSTNEGDRVADVLLPSHPAVSRDDAEAIASWLTTLRRPLNAVPAAEGEPVRGDVHFQKILGCASCHRLGDEGGLSAPELGTAMERLDPQWLRAFVFDAPSWSPALMPRMAMRGAQLAAVTDYIAAADRSAPSGGAAGSVAAPRAGVIFSARGEMLYQLYCSQCHGIRGNGKGIRAVILLAGRDHTSADEMGMLTDERLFAAIKFGGRASANRR
jgi:mono/diheme cytochrome c family protein